MANSLMDELRVYIDGGCRGELGPGALGILVLDADNNEVAHHSEYVGNTTMIHAEYVALLAGLKQCLRYTRGRVICFCGSQLVVNQMKGLWRLKDASLRSVYFEVKRMEQQFDLVTYTYVKRNNPFIRKADRLLNHELEGKFWHN